jgi:hypothetical protein
MWFEYPEEGHIFNSSSVSIGWVGMDLSSGMETFFISKDGGQWGDRGVIYTTTLTDLSEGLHRIRLKGMDKAGNCIIAYVNFTVDTTNPTVESYGPTGSDLDPSILRINATFSEEMDMVNLRFLVSGGVTGIVTWAANKAFFNPDETLEYGRTYQIKVDGSDLAGNRMQTLIWSFSTDNRGSVRGQVLDTTNKPITTAIITVDETAEYRTGADGTFTFLVIAGEHDLKIEAPGFISIQRSVDLSAGEEIDLGQLKLDQRLDMGTLKGRVVDNKGDPLFAVIVTLDTGDTITTEEDGTFSFYVPVGSYKVSFNRDRYFRTTATATVNVDSTTDLGDVEMTPTESDVQEDEEGLDLLQIQIIIFIVILVVGIGVIFVIRRRSRAGLVEEE